MLTPQTTLNCKGHLLDLAHPIVMGILNATPDSFFDGGKYDSESASLRQVETMLAEGATIIDIGGMSSRPGAEVIDTDEELRRILPLVEKVTKTFPQAIISIDTVRAKVAQQAIETGAHLINDISAGQFDENLYQTVADLGIPYVLMHMQGTPKTMQQEPNYDDVVQDVLDFFIQEVGKLRNLGVKDIVLDPGFGFGKSIDHNYALLANMHIFKMLDLPTLVGVSRKSMIYKYLNISPEEALNGTSTLHLTALQQGAKILRAHDVKEAMEVIKLHKIIDRNSNQ